MKKTISIWVTCLSAQFAFAQWTVQNVASSNTLYGISFVGANNIFISETNGLRKSTNGGSSWSLLPLQDQLGNPIPGSILYDTYFFDTNNGVATGLMAIGNSETILRTTNGGANWTMVSIYNSGNLPRLLNDIYFPTATIGYAVGTNGRILKSNDAGLTWSPQTSGTTNELNSVYFNSATNGVAVGNQVILKTIDGGSSWALTSLPVTFNSVHFANANTGLAVGNAIYKTTDGGNTWTQRSKSITAGFTGVYTYDADTAFASTGAGVA